MNYSSMTGIGMGVSLVAGIGGALARSNAPYPRPGSTPEQIQAFFRSNRGAARVAVAGQTMSALMLAGFTRSVARLGARSGSRAATAAAVAGGAAAAGALGYSAACNAKLTTAAGDDDKRAQLLHRHAFLAGGPGHGAAFGVLMGALGVGGRRTEQLPGRLTAAAGGSALANLLSPLYLAAEQAVWFIPVGRFSGLIVSAIAGTRME